MENFAVYLKSIDIHYVYFILLLSCYLENIFPPLPGDSVLVIGAYLTGIGFLRFEYTYIVTCLGSILGFMTFYYIGVIFKNRIILKRNREKKFSEKTDKIEKWFNRYGYKIIIANRFLVVLRSLIALTAGFLNLDSKKVFYYSLISILAWNGILIYLGYKLGENWDKVLTYLRQYNISVISVLVFAAIVYVLFYFIKNSRTKKM